jgi:hypothetical protein
MTTSTSTSSRKQDPQNPFRNIMLSPITFCLLFECMMHRNVCVPFIWDVGYFHRNKGVMSLFQASKELHLYRVDILRAEFVVLERMVGTKYR